MDLTGKRFGKQVVVEELGYGYVKIKCDCGTIKRTRKWTLQTGKSQSCGCSRRSTPRPDPLFVGKRFSRLVIRELLGRVQRNQQALVECDCGAIKVVGSQHLRSGATRSCGCLRRAVMPLAHRTHGEGGRGPTRSVLYGTWRAIFDRIYTPRYRERDVRLCERWHTFTLFRDDILADIGPRPRGMSLDRKDNDQGYEPGNVRWATPTQQARNRASNVLITVDGVTRCISEWAEVLGTKPRTISARILYYGWSPERAVTTPARVYKRY